MDANGVTDLGEACIQLNEKLSRNAFMSDATGSFAPAIFLLSDGEPTDNYKYGLKKLKQNRSEEHTSELQSLFNLVCRLLLEKKNTMCSPNLILITL